MLPPENLKLQLRHPTGLQPLAGVLVLGMYQPDSIEWPALSACGPTFKDHVRVEADGHSIGLLELVE